MLFAPLRGGAFECPMSYQSYNPYGSSYSNPSTPQQFTWDVDHPEGSVTTPQDAISPLVFQQQQLSPMEATTPQEQPQAQPQHLAAFELHQRTIQLQERVAPSQFRFDNIDESHFTDAGRHKAPSRVGVDEMRSSTSPAGSSGAAGPSRVPHGRAHTQSHPYRRPRTGASPGQQATTATSVSSTVSRRTPTRGGREESVLTERTSQLHRGTEVPSTPAVGSGKAVSCPAMSVWRATLYPSENNCDQQGQGAASGGGGPSGTTTRYADLSPSSSQSRVSLHVFISPPPPAPVAQQRQARLKHRPRHSSTCKHQHLTRRPSASASGQTYTMTQRPTR